MRQVYFQRWVFGKMQDVETSIEVLDGYNKTRYSRKKIKNLELLVEAAKDAHQNSLIYFVTILENEKAYCFLEISKGYFRVYFLDEQQRKYMSYDFTDDFKDIRPNKLFLSQIVFWEFEGNTDKIIKTSSHIFKADGSFLMIERDSRTNEQVSSESKNKIDVSANWEDYPEFGKYDSLIRKERA